MNKMIVTLFGIVLAISLIGCETFKGIGKDLENTGDNIQDLMDRSYDTK